MALHTQSVYCLAIHTTAETAKPTIPSAGSHMSFGTAWSVIGSQDEGHNVDMDDDKITFNEVRENVTVKPPRAYGIHATNRKSIGHGPFEFTAYDMSDTLVALDSDKTVASGVTSISTSRAYRTVMVEFTGYKSRYFPKCLVETTSMTASQDEKGAATVKVKITPLATTSYAAAYSDDTFDGA